MKPVFFPILYLDQTCALIHKFSDLDQPHWSHLFFTKDHSPAMDNDYSTDNPTEQINASEASLDSYSSDEFHANDPGAEDHSHDDSHADPVHHPTVLSTDSLLMVRGSFPGARIALTAGVTVLGEEGNPIVSIRKSFGHFSITSADATVLVTHNGDPLPPAPKGIRNNDSICFRDFELVCELDEPDTPYA